MLSLDDLPKLTDEDKKMFMYLIIGAKLKEHIKENDYYRRHPEEI